MDIITDLLGLAMFCLLAALFVHTLFCIGFKRKFLSRYNLTVVTLCALYVAVLIEATWLVGNGWVLGAGLILPLACAFLKAYLETS